MEGMYDWPYYTPFETHDNYPPPTLVHNPNPPVPSRRRPMPSQFMGGGYHTTPASRRMPPVRSVPKPAKQVVSIPVNFIGSRPTRSDYAVKIQKAFRGFRIRKNVSKILELKRGVDEVERDLMEGESVELIIRDDGHRLKASETLMALLLKLDSIRGLNDAVRVCRKGVIRKAILLQERMDSLAAENLDSKRMQVEETNNEETAEEDKSDRKLVGKVSEIDETAHSEMQIEKDSESEAWECVDDGKVENVEFGDEGDKTTVEEDTKQGWLMVEEEENKVLVEKMAEDNRRLMEMIAELCNKKDNQTRLIQSLSKRVEQLEQGMNDRITRKKDKKKKKQMMLNTLSYS